MVKYIVKKTRMPNWLRVGYKEITIYQAQKFGIKPFDRIGSSLYKKLKTMGGY